MGLTLLFALIAAVGPLHSEAASPSAGRVGPTSDKVAWSGPVRTSNSSGLACSSPAAYCDDFSLTVDVDRDYWAAREGGALVEISWSNPNDSFELFIFDRTGVQVASDGFNPATDVGKTAGGALIRNASSENSPYKVQVIYRAVANSSYVGSATFVSGDEGSIKGEGAVFDSSQPIGFAPATIVSAHFLGAEPGLTIERRIDGSQPGVVDPDRIFIDYPLSTRAQIGQVNRSTDGGDSFRLVFDPACSHRSRPTCQTGGGGDSDTDVNLFNGTLFFSDQQGVVAQEAIASSTNHGDSFPPQRQFAVSNTTTASDRQWLAAADEGSITVGPREVHAFLAYARVASGIYVQGVDEEGVPIPQPDAQIGPTLGVPGLVRVDTSGGPGHGWVYVAYPRLGVTQLQPPKGTVVAAAPGNSYRDPSAWVENKVSSDLPQGFIWLSLDNAGNAYATWVENGVVYYSSSSISDPANDPTKGGRPGTLWSQQYRVSDPSVGSAIFPVIFGGDPGRVAIAYVGTTDHKGSAATAGADSRWHTYAAVIEEAISQTPIVHTGKVSHRVVHTGEISDSGDHSLLDFIDVGVDQDGRVGVAFMDNQSTFGEVTGSEGDKGKPFTHFAKQVSGPSLLAGDADPAITIPEGERSDAQGDSTWPNTSSGRYLPSLDALGASIGLEGDRVVARVPLQSVGADVRRADLASYNSAPATSLPAERLQYVVRFSTPTDVFHMSAATSGDQLQFYGGRLDENDSIAHGGTVVMASHRSDPFYTVLGSIEGNELVLRGSAAAFGLSSGSELFSVTAFTMAGPSEANETLFSPMRTVDATPPFDATLQLFSASPSVSASIGTSPSPVDSLSPTPQDTPSSSPSPDPTPEGRCDVVGTSGNDVLVGTEESETICGGAGHDVIFGKAGDDTLRGGKGNDRMFGGAGNDILVGASGSDEIGGGRGKDTLRGKRGPDLLNGGPQADRLFGGTGNDRLKGSRGIDDLRGGPGRDRLFGGRGRDTCTKDRGRQSCERRRR